MGLFFSACTLKMTRNLWNVSDKECLLGVPNRACRESSILLFQRWMDTVRKLATTSAGAMWAWPGECPGKTDGLLTRIWMALRKGSSLGPLKLSWSADPQAGSVFMTSVMRALFPQLRSVRWVCVSEVFSLTVTWVKRFKQKREIYSKRKKTKNSMFFRPVCWYYFLRAHKKMVFVDILFHNYY